MVLLTTDFEIGYFNIIEYALYVIGMLKTLKENSQVAY